MMFNTNEKKVYLPPSMDIVLFVYSEIASYSNLDKNGDGWVDNWYHP
ncbi:MAG: hypothetical protein PHH84_06620 [Oscillospiraceae bacterium]|nr:hypothetical protein [Oscillospiraceae bacterium]MDD4413330.1 hypothetical protein [Oscillospiraceae bacterium]